MEKIKKLDKFLSYEVCFIESETSIDDFAKRNNIRKEQVVYENEFLQKGDIVLIKELNKTLHIVLPLETLSSIAKKYNVSVEYIKQENKTNQIFIGQQLYI